MQPRGIRRIVVIETLDGSQRVLLTDQRGMVRNDLIKLGGKRFQCTRKRGAIYATAERNAGQQKREQQEVSRDSRERIDGTV